MRGDEQRTTLPSAECLAFDAHLEAYLEGEDRPQVTVHASQCAFCGAVLADVEKIRRLSTEADVPEGFEAEPSPDLWLSLRASLVSEGIIHEPQTFWSRWIGGWQFVRKPIPILAAAGAVIVCVFLLNAPWSSLHLRHGRQASGVPGGFSRPLAMVEPNVQLQETVNQMERSFQAKLTSFDPSLRDAYVKSLASLDDEIVECQKNAQVQPHNPLTLQYLSTAYAQKAEVLQSALETPAP